MTFGFMEDMIWYDATWCNLMQLVFMGVRNSWKPNKHNKHSWTHLFRTHVTFFRTVAPKHVFARPPGLFAIRWNLPVDHASCGETFGSWIGYDWRWLDMIGWCKNPLTLEVVFLKLLDVQVSPGSFQFPPSRPGMFVWCMAGWIAVNERFTNASDACWSHGGSFWAYSELGWKVQPQT